MKKVILLIFLLGGVLTCIQAHKERVTGRSIYEPRDGGFFVYDGTNRYTRALYGGRTNYRIETSDRPVFAIYKGKRCRNVRFFLDDLQLDSTEHCEAIYKDGVRSYKLTDSRWGKGVLYVDVVALPDSEGAIWKFKSEGFGNSVKLTSKVCAIANIWLFRNGDLGVDKPGSFEASPKEDSLVVESTSFNTTERDTIAYASLDFLTISFAKHDQSAQNVARQYISVKSYYKSLCSRIQFKCPDPYISNLGGPLVLAADGLWDGHTWLHGAVGWRVALAGWRAGYLGDVLGWNDRAISHFNAYANSQVTDVPVTIPGPSQDENNNLARAAKKWGTEIYSNGYICKNPNRNDQMNHYDMNLNYIDELLWHFEYDADTAYMRRMWPVLTRHLAWEKRNFDSDNNHLYDAYCCMWASDALFYNNGAVTHSSAYNYRGNLLAARIADIIGENSEPYRDEAEAIRKAINERLWLTGKKAYVPSAEDLQYATRTDVPAHWAEFQDNMGNKLMHPDAAVWSEYTPIDCEVGTPEQMYEAARYLDVHIPHIALDTTQKDMAGAYTISSSDWMPYDWSVNNVASAEVMHTALAFFEAGNAYKGYKLMRGNILDQMYLGQSPANFGQVSYYDAARGESYRDFGDNIGVSARTLIQGFFGINPQALDGKCVIRPGFPLGWDSVEVKTPYLSYKYNKVASDKAQLHIVQNFSRPLDIVVRINGERYAYTDYCGSNAVDQVIEVAIPTSVDTINYVEVTVDDFVASEKLGLLEHSDIKRFTPQQMKFNANVSDIFRNEYISPRPSTTSLELPKQGVGEWCHPKWCPEINDSVFRSLAVGNRFVVEGIPFKTPQRGKNIFYTSLWDNYPSTVTIPLTPQKATVAYLLLAGSTNHMQTHIDNAIVKVNYTDGSSDTLHLLPPFNWCPIEQDYYVDGKAFQTVEPRPVRICLGTGTVSRNLGEALRIKENEVYGRLIKGGAAQMLEMPLNNRKVVKSLTLTTLANDVVVGLMGVTLGK